MNWLVLRCNSKSTIALVESLEQAGFEGMVWSPTELVLARSGPDRSREKVKSALLPSFVFVDEFLETEMLREERDPLCNHPPFRIFRFNRVVAKVAAESLLPLRSLEKKPTEKANHPTLPAGTVVRTAESGFEGLNGVVVSCKGRWSFVEFEGFALPVKISTLLLVQERA